MLIMSTLSKAAQAEITERAMNAREYLRALLVPGDAVTTVVSHVARSGMRRSIKVLIVADGQPADVSWAVCRAVGWKFDDTHGGVIVDGCGMDMGFHLVYTLATHLFAPYWECAGDRCPSNDHSNGREVTLHAEAGYALRHAWV